MSVRNLYEELVRLTHPWLLLVRLIVDFSIKNDSVALDCDVLLHLKGESCLASFLHCKANFRSASIIMVSADYSRV